MKKKLISLILLCMLILPSVFMLTGCGGFKTDVDYVFDDVKIEWKNEEAKSNELGDETEQQYIDSIKEEQKDFVLMFAKNGEFYVWQLDQDGKKDETTKETSYYTQTDNKIDLYDNAEKTGDAEVSFVVDGVKLIQKVELDTIGTITISYKQA